MKKIFILAIVFSLAGTVIGQVPASFKYQAVLRDIRGNIEANTATNIIIDILQGSETGSVVYSETHSVTTDGYGLINLDLGNGTATVGSISAINWNTGIFFVKVTVDGVVMGTSQLLSVPYALYSAKSANGFSGNYNDLINKPTLSTGTVTSVSGTSPLTVVAGTTSPVISMAQANGSSNGYLSSTDWATFSNKSSFSGTWTDLSGKPIFSTVATSGSYNDLINKPTISNGTVTNVSGTAPVNVIAGTTSPVISMAQANGTTNGYLTSTDWTTFNNKGSFSGAWTDLSGKPVFATVATSGSYNDLINKPTISNGTVTSVTGTAPINVLTGTTSPVISMAQANGTTNGYLSSTDWTTFSNKSSFSGTWTDLSGKPVFATVATSGNYNDLTNKADGSETKIIAGANIKVDGTGKDADKYIISTISHEIGESFGGGIVFYVDPTGLHGLVAASKDQSNGIEWWIDKFNNKLTTYAERNGIGAGIFNTERIIIGQASGTYAAQLCANYQDSEIDSHGDWYLPSDYELILMYTNLKAKGLGDFADDIYWSSNGYTVSNDTAYNFYILARDFSTGETISIFNNGWGDVSPLHYARAIRAF